MKRLFGILILLGSVVDGKAQIIGFTFSPTQQTNAGFASVYGDPHLAVRTATGNGISITTISPVGAAYMAAIYFDSGGDLFVLNANDITAYHPGTTSPYLTFNRNNAGESYMAIDSSNNLYVTAATGGHFNLGYFKVFDLGSGKLLRTVSRDVNGPFGFAIGP